MFLLRLIEEDEQKLNLILDKYQLNPNEDFRSEESSFIISEKLYEESYDSQEARSASIKSSVRSESVKHYPPVSEKTANRVTKLKLELPSGNWMDEE